MTDQPRRRSRQARKAPAAGRQVNYKQLKNPFPPMNAVSEDEARSIHETSLRILEELGMRVLLPEARALFQAEGARVEDDMVFIGRDMVEDALAVAPKSFPLKGAHASRDLTMELGSLTFQPGAGAPHATCRVKGRRPGTSEDFRELVQITHHFDALHLVPTLVEAQDVPIQLRHYDMVKTALVHSDRAFFIYSRGTPQVQDAFEMMRLYRGLSQDEFEAAPYSYTIINTNSPRTLDIPMAQGVMDFARANQISIITPFTLMGAMAPITPAGAVTLSHAEALAAITLGQLTRPGAPQMYGTFTSNVDMKSGAPAFGTPEHFRASLLAGQLARLIGLPWRCASGSASNINDSQGANENQLALWGCLLAGATTVVHAAGWLEGGLTVSYEKLVCDMDAVNAVADLCTPTEATEDAIGFDAIAEVAPQGHFFAATQTMARYQTEFYQPVVSDWSNYGSWEEKGGLTAHERATEKWQEILRESGPAVDPDRYGALTDFIAKRSAEGGAPPVS
ncbi:MAG: trimethylamine methyltransferase family protein [Rhodobacteraceae bacterium]|nr:trimethylamine methyltransferase family protein [Paracoccaceae bacterium]